MKILTSKTMALCVGVFTMSLAVFYLAIAWVEPSNTPPDLNVSAPINAGGTAQVKSGNLTILGTVGIGTTNPTQKLDVNGYAKGRAGLCIGEDCRDAWGAKGVDQNCAANSAMIGIKADGTIVCGNGTCSPGTCSSLGYDCGTADDGCGNTIDCGSCSSGACTNNKCSCRDSMASCTKDADCCSGECSSSGLCATYYPCSDVTLPSGDKKIFVTSNIYNGKGLTEIAADAKCAAAAKAVGYKGTYKALVYAGSRDINKVITSGKSFWNGYKSGTKCVWKLVANNMSDFFTKDSSGNYISNPILYNELGGSESGVEVWTNFAPNGSGGYTLYPVGKNITYPMCTYTSDTASHALCLVGNPTSKKITWAYTVKDYSAGIAVEATYQACSVAKALYCIEQ